MSGRHAMAVSLACDLEGVGDRSLHDACIVFAETLVRNAATVIEGVKPAAIFSLPMHAYAGGCWRQLTRESLDEALRAYERALPDYGIWMRVLYRTERRVYLLVWRLPLLAGALDDAQGIAILRECGYRGTSVRELVRELRRRLVAYYLSLGGPGASLEFPHEIGVFLGYPADDVRSFMAGKRPVCIGAWNAYGDEQAARRRFRMLKQHERRCWGRFAAGEPLHALFAT